MSNLANSDQLKQQSSSLVDWLILSQVPQIGQAKLQSILSQHRLSSKDLLTLPRASLQQLGLNSKQIARLQQPDEKLIQRCLSWQAAAEQHAIIPIDHENYPYLLKQISCPPLVLFIAGEITLLHQPQLAMVGSRQPSAAGSNCARQFAAALTQCGWIITSGLARGIDAACHQAAIDANGHTIAVLGTGVDMVYPKYHRHLQQKILDSGGCLLSEFVPGTPPRAEHFPRRNRIVSGLSRGVLVVEAAFKSGSLITARYGLEQGREVFAIPGNINNPMVQGCHQLIKQGAKLVAEVADINEEFQNLVLKSEINKPSRQEKSKGESLATDKLLVSVDFDVTAIDVIAERSNMLVSDVLATLLEYELRGLVAAVPGGYIKLRGK